MILRSGVSRSILAIALLVVVLVIGAGAYFALMPGGGAITTSSTSTSSTSSTSTMVSSSSSTSSSTSAVQTSSTSTTTSLTTTCPATTTTTSTASTTSTTSTSPAALAFPGLARILGNFSQMTVWTQGSSSNSTGGTTFTYNYTSSYMVLSSPKTGGDVFKVNFTGTYANPKTTGIVWLYSNGTIISVLESGVNSTGNAALGEVVQLGSIFQTEYFYGADLQSYLSFPGLHQINQTTLQLGPTSVTVTNYGLEGPSGFCNGSGLIADTSFNIQAGMLPGTKLTLVPLWSQTGTFTPNGKSSYLASSVSIKVISVVAA